MSDIPVIVLAVISYAALLVPGFAVAYLLRFRSRTWGSVLLSAGLVSLVFGWLAAFSYAGLALFLAGALAFGAGVEGMAFPRRPRPSS